MISFFSGPTHFMISGYAPMPQRNDTVYWALWSDRLQLRSSQIRTITLTLLTLSDRNAGRQADVTSDEYL